MRHQPDGRGVIGNAVPVIQMHDLVDLVKSAAEISGVLLHGESVSVRRDPDRLDIFLHIAGQASRHAGEDEPDALGLPRIRYGGKTAHHDDIRIPQMFCDVPCQIQAVAGAGIAEDHIFAHGGTLLHTFIFTG